MADIAPESPADFIGIRNHQDLVLVWVLVSAGGERHKTIQNEELRKTRRFRPWHHPLLRQRFSSPPFLRDLLRDAADAKSRLIAPMLVLWGRQGVVGQLFDVSCCWHEKAIDVQGEALDSGHLVHEEAPQDLLALLDRFLLKAC